MLGTFYIAALGRVLLAAIFLASGAQKIFTPEQTQQYIASANLPEPLILYWVAIAIEIVGGIALVAGVQVRLAALLLTAFTLVAAVIFHTDFADQNQTIHFMKNLAIAGGLLQVFAFGKR